MLGATGAIYALRRSLWHPLPPGTILDDVLAPMRAVLAGHRVVFEPARARVRLHVARCRRREPAQDPHARRQRADPVVRAAAAGAGAQPGVAAVRVAQDRPPARALRVDGAVRLEPRAVAERSLVLRVALFSQVAFYLHGGYGAWLEHWISGGAARTVARAAHRRSGFHHRGHERVGRGRCRRRAARQEGLAMISARVSGSRSTSAAARVPSRQVVEAAIARENAPTFATAAYNEPRDWGYAGLLAFTTVLMTRPQDTLPVPRIRSTWPRCAPSSASPRWCCTGSRAASPCSASRRKPSA